MSEVNREDSAPGAEFHEGEDVKDLAVLKDRLIAKLGNKEYEVLWAVFINSDDKLKGIEQIAVGDEGTVAADHDLVLSRVKANGVKKFAVLHNHPNGAATPSFNDDMVTLSLLLQAHKEGLFLVDSLVVNDKRVGSIRHRKYL